MFVIKVFKRSPVSASFFPIYERCYIGAKTREEGGTRCQRALTVEGDRGAVEVGQQEKAETASGCSKQWSWSNRRKGGTEGSLPCSWVEEGWLPSEREQRSLHRSPGGRSLLPSAMFGEEQGTGEERPATLDRRSHPPGGRQASGRIAIDSSRIDVQYHRMAPGVRASQLVEDQTAVCQGTGPIIVFLSRLCLSSSAVVIIMIDDDRE